VILKKSKEYAVERSELRQWAAEQLKNSGFAYDLPSSAAELQRVVQEFSIHQIELEMQNEELKNSRNELQKAQKRYADLYDFAPVSYMSIAPDNTILEANLTAARSLFCERSHLKGACFGSFIAQAGLSACNSMVHKVFQSRTLENSELMFRGEISALMPSSATIFRSAALH